MSTEGTDFQAELQDLIARGMTFTDAICAFGEPLESSDYGRAAKAHLQEDGALEFDELLVVSRGADDGAYVLCWAWTPNEWLQPEPA
jgi:hypothetical protein